MILDILTRVHIPTDPAHLAGILTTGLPLIGMKITGPEKDAAFIRALLSDIHSRLDTKLDGYWDSSNYKDVLISVIVKSAGFPEIRICDPWPTCDYDRYIAAEVAHYPNGRLRVVSGSARNRPLRRT